MELKSGHKFLIEQQLVGLAAYVDYGVHIEITAFHGLQFTSYSSNQVIISSLSSYVGLKEYDVLTGFADFEVSRIGRVPKPHEIACVLCR